MFTSQLVCQGLCKQPDIVRVFGVSAKSVKRYVAKFRLEGIASFYQPRNTRGATVITNELIFQAQERLNRGLSRREVADDLGVKYDTLRKAINQGRLREPHQPHKSMRLRMTNRPDLHRTTRHPTNHLLRPPTNPIAVKRTRRRKWASVVHDLSSVCSRLWACSMCHDGVRRLSRRDVWRSTLCPTGLGCQQFVLAYIEDLPDAWRLLHDVAGRDSAGLHGAVPHQDGRTVVGG